ncbi:MAG: hypothetical protein IJ523_03075 [Succinivibrionaceae bacterium]|nr:hypothetical protein [Succinivibrionaceae bacterium]
MESHLEDILTWHVGYNIAGNDMNCPWSVMNFLSEALQPTCAPATFPQRNQWPNASGNDILKI